MRVLVSLSLICLVLLSGCTDKKTPATQSDVSVDGLITRARRGEIVGVNEQQVKAIIENFKGDKVVLVNFWATWCPPCVEEFPDLVKLHQTYQAKGLEVVTVSADSPKAVESKIKPFLEQHKATFLAFVKDTKDDGVFIEAIDSAWGGEIPVTFIYDRSGERAASFYGKQDWNGFVAAVEPLLE